MPKSGNHSNELRRERQRRYRETHTTVSISFPNEKARELHEAALKAGKTPPDLLKLLLDHYLVETYEFVLPRESRIQTLVLSIRRIGNDINLLTRYIHTKPTITQGDIQSLQSHLITLDRKIKNALSKPPTIQEVIAQHLEQHPKTLPLILHYVTHYDNQGKRR